MISEHHLNATAYLRTRTRFLPSWPQWTILWWLPPAGYYTVSQSSDHLKLVSGPWWWVPCTPVAPAVTRSQTSGAPFGMRWMPVTLAYRNISRSICACYCLQLETFESLFLASHELQPHCVPVCSTQEISRILQRSFTVSTSHPCHECCCHSSMTEHTH